ncbi:hypothetical protein AVEN_205888-1, partial [Araneus ventricosus]
MSGTSVKISVIPPINGCSH